MRQFRRLLTVMAILVFGFGLTTSCSKDDDINTPMATCEDGIKNGTETDIDCGGNCTPCTTGVTPGRRAELYVTNNANGNITRYSVTGDSLTTFTTGSMAAEGIVYNSNDDEVIIASRSGLQLNAFTNFSMLTEDADLNADYSSSADLESPREVAFNGSTYVVSDTGSNIFYVYTKNGSAFSLSATVQIPFPVWGITFKGDDLYAVVDFSNDLAVFYGFAANATTGTLNPSKRISIEGIIRTHGITYNGTDDLLVMTDIGDADNTMDDGGFQVIPNFSSTFDALSDGETLGLDMQIRIAGPSTMLGNPIDVAYDSEENAVYISDIGTGKILGFSGYSDGGDLSPNYMQDLASASSIYFSSDETDGNNGISSENRRTELYATSTANGNITVYNNSGSLLSTITTSSTSSEGIFYSGINDAVIQASRSGMVLEYYSDFSSAPEGSVINPEFSSSASLMSPREIAVLGNKIVVSDNAEHKFYIFSYNGTSFTLENTLDPGFNVWGITFKGDDLIAVVDNSSDIVIYNDFLSNSNGMLMADKRITVEGIVRTHGIDYSEADDVLVLTDIGDAANVLTDGGFQVIKNFSQILDNTSDGGSISLADQLRVSGPSTLLGNPIDIAYDSKTKMVYIAEIGNGKILGFPSALNNSGNIAPSLNNNLAGASSIFLYNN